MQKTQAPSSLSDFFTRVCLCLLIVAGIRFWPGDNRRH